jgi:hypothetical protein
MAWIETAIEVIDRVIVAEVVESDGGSAEEVIGENIRINDDSRPIAALEWHDEARVDAYRRVQDSSTSHGVIPETIDKDVAQGSPNITGGDPNPAGSTGDVIAGPPRVTGVEPHPGTRNPRLLDRGRLSRRTILQTVRWRRQILHFVLFFPLPES